MKRSCALILIGTLALTVGGGSGAGAADDPSAEIAGLDESFATGGWGLTPLSAEGSDRFRAVAVGEDGQVYAAGFLTEDGDQAMALARIGADGALDETFGEDGVASVNVAVGGETAELASGLAVQSSGEVVIGGPVEHDPEATGDDARDLDIAISRFDDTGMLDPTFGTDGTTLFDLSTGVLVPPPAGSTADPSFVGDLMWGVTVLPDDSLIVVAAKRAEGDDRTDRDFALLKLTADGALDPDFGTDGMVIIDIDGGNESPRQAIVQPDGMILMAGYTRDAESVVKPVLVRLADDGTLDETFGEAGIASAELLAAVAEAYDVTMQGDDYVITGYGRDDPEGTVDLIAARFTADGALDETFGEDGLVRLDIAGEDDRGRDLVALPDGRLLIAGSGKPTEDDLNAMLVLLNPDGSFDDRFGEDGHLLVDLGGPNDSFYSVALTPDDASAMVVGWMGAEADTGGDDAAVARVAIAAY
ncbi:MAG: hypothetical protein ACRD0K_03375 [Egibacteraceae bacterium]